MTERQYTSLCNARKSFIKCVDCCRQTLPQNVTTEEPWVSASALYTKGSANDGVLCFQCANKRRMQLGLPLVASKMIAPVSTQPSAGDATAATCEKTFKNIRINTRKYSGEIGSLEALVAKWCAATFPNVVQSQDRKFLLVAINNTRIQAEDFSSTPIAEGDDITILVGGKF